MAREGEGKELDLAQLSRASRVSPRTIRYYIHQGLLPSPGKRGRGARYDRGVLDRLELIKQLQRDGWPLGKIVERMAELDEQGVVPQRTTWERVRVSADVEISVRTRLSAAQRKRAERLIEAARRTFREK